MNQKPTALLFSTVWPEPESSAAGVRQLQWIAFFKKAGFEVVLSSPSKPKDGTEFGAICIPLPLNRSEVREELRRLDPQVVLFDRFLLEEQFGHFVYEECPQALVLLETVDLHFVRRARQSVRENYLEMDPFPSELYRSETAIRETASIQRVDYSYVVSSFEEELLAQDFGLGLEKVQWVPFLYEPVLFESHFQKSFSERSGFSWIGNFRHAPNMDGLRWFLAEIWPKVRARLPDAKLNIYGAYPTAEAMGWTNPAKGIVSHGQAKTLEEVFKNARVNLAPLRFGAGVKGKILEGLRHGVPCVTTKVGVEGLLPPKPADFAFPGIEANTVDAFVEGCVSLYENELAWTQKRMDAVRLLDEVYSEAATTPKLLDQLIHLLAKKRLGELPDWTSQILRHELVNSHKYFSKWIELKEATAAAAKPAT
jgi:glycosyltransferase involved in cell wall biosynthesis